MTAHATGPLPALREALLEAGYQQPARSAQRSRSAFSRPDGVPAAVGDSSSDRRLGGLIDLFAYGRELEHRAATRALAPATPDALARAGILQRRNGRWRSRFMIAGDGDVFVLGDLPRRGRRRDHVDGVTSVALLAHHLTVPVNGGSLLDLGTGSGIQALLAARAGGRVVGTDVNARALRMAQLGAQLSAVSDVRWREGSWYEPVAGERFDRIVCVAPYVVSPDSEFTFRDGDRAGEEPVRVATAGARAHLAAGGCAQVLVCWGHGAAEDWSRTPMSWLAPRGADVLLLRLAEVDPVRYALSWNRPPLRTLTPTAYDEVMGRWLTYYARQGFDQISFAAVCIRRRTSGAAAGTGRLSLDATAPCGEQSGAQIGRALINLELLAGCRDDAALRALAPAIPEGQRVEQRLQHDGQRYRLRRASVRQGDGLGVSVAVSAAVLEAIYRLDGRRTLDQALTDVGVKRNAAGRTRTAETLAAVRELAQAGLLELQATNNSTTTG